MDSDTVWQHIDTERSWLADLLESLPEAAWTRPSLCAGWSVRDVAAHLRLRPGAGAGPDLALGPGRLPLGHDRAGHRAA